MSDTDLFRRFLGRESPQDAQFTNAFCYDILTLAIADLGTKYADKVRKKIGRKKKET